LDSLKIKNMENLNTRILNLLKEYKEGGEKVL